MLIRVIDLIGRNVSGQLADVRHRTATGELRYEHTEKDGPRVRKLVGVSSRRRSKDEVARGIGNADWVTLRWEPLADCGFGGTCGSDDQANWFIEMQEVSNG